MCCSDLWHFKFLVSLSLELIELNCEINWFDWIDLGNILISFEPSLMTDMIKSGFLLSIVLSFPLCVLPCRTSLHSLIYGRVRSSSEHSCYWIEIDRIYSYRVMITLKVELPYRVRKFRNCVSNVWRRLLSLSLSSLVSVTKLFDNFSLIFNFDF